MLRPNTVIALLISLSLLAGPVALARAAAVPQPPAPAAQQDLVTVTGTAARTFFATYHPDLPLSCRIQADETVLAIGRVADGPVRVYAGGPACEGPVWIPADAPVEWANPARLARVAQLSAPELAPVIDDLPEYAAICAAAADPEAPRAPLDPAAVSTVYSPGSWALFPPAFVATDATGIDVIVCQDRRQESLGICPNITTRVERVQQLMTVRLVDFESGAILSEAEFTGPEPPACPSVAAEEDVLYGLPPTRDAWTAWTIGAITGREGDRLRSVSIVNRLNARSEPTTRSEILDILPFETPINPIGRNEEATWVVVLLPDMRPAWLFAELIDVAVSTDVSALPVYDGPAADVPVWMGGR